METHRDKETTDGTRAVETHRDTQTTDGTRAVETHRDTQTTDGTRAVETYGDTQTTDGTRAVETHSQETHRPLRDCGTRAAQQGNDQDMPHSTRPTLLIAFARVRACVHACVSVFACACM